MTSGRAAAGGGGGGFQTQRDLLRGSSKTWWALSTWVSVGFGAVVVQSGPPGQGARGPKGANHGRLPRPAGEPGLLLGVGEGLGQ